MGEGQENAVATVSTVSDPEEVVDETSGLSHRSSEDNDMAGDFEVFPTASAVGEDQKNAVETVSTVSQSQEVKFRFGGNMAHALVKIFVHFVWSTKYGKRLLLGGTSEQVKSHIEEYARENSIGIVQLAIQPEHVHLLTSMSRTQHIEDIVGRIKGESSHWINQTNLIRSKFSWQTGYWAGSVCYQHLNSVKSYIQGQQEHHRVKSFREEFETILRRDGYSEEEIALLLVGASR